MKAEGFQALITKATEGIPSLGAWTTDDNYDEFQQDAEANEFPFGSFHYWRAIVGPVEQAEHYYSVATKQAKPLFPPILDLERKNNLNVLSQSAASAHAQLLALKTEELWGAKPWIYTSYYACKELFGNPDWMREYFLWVASYRNDVPSIPVPWQGKEPEYILWQYTSIYPLPGANFSGYDANYFVGTQNEWEALIGSLAPPPPIVIPKPPFKGIVNRPGNAPVRGQPNGWFNGLYKNGAKVWIDNLRYDEAGIPWYRMGKNVFIEAKFILPLE